MRFSSRVAVPSIDLIHGIGFAASMFLFYSGNLTPPFSFLSSNFHSDRRKRPIIDLSCVQELDDAIHLFHEMVRMRPQPSFTELLNSVEMKRYFIALYLFDEMRRTGASVNECTLIIAINCYCLVKRVDFSFALMGIFLKSWFEPKVTAFSTLIRELFFDHVGALLDLRLCEPNDVMIQFGVVGVCKMQYVDWECLGLLQIAFAV